MRRRGFLSALLIPLLPTPQLLWKMDGNVYIFNDVRFFGSDICVKIVDIPFTSRPIRGFSRSFMSQKVQKIWPRRSVS